MITDYSVIVFLIAVLAISITFQSGVLYLLGWIFKVENLRFLPSLYVILLSNVLLFVINLLSSYFKLNIFISLDIVGIILVLLILLIVAFLLIMFLTAKFFNITGLKAAGITLLYFVFFILISIFCNIIFLNGLLY